ncbi:CAP family protein [Nocardia australiensis]|uniref:CAP family protein n=1 Tax=Nocardia australiensis TaxID=2887191 RepID=UPI001D15B83B|nr:CAP family protein [Nocardia australiensis]
MSVGITLLLAAAVTGVGTATAQQSGECGGASFVNDMLSAHNEYRARHQAPPLTLDPALTDYAQQWANHLAAIGQLEHSTDGHSENLFYASGMQVTGTVPTKAWYDEIKDYDYDNPGFSKETGHFTQVVWKSSTKLGAAITCKGSESYVVASYDPAGNVIGQFPQNVGRLS